MASISSGWRVEGIPVLVSERKKWQVFVLKVAKYWLIRDFGALDLLIILEKYQIKYITLKEC